ncbi:TfoX/Sxy family protein [Lysobacter sp. HA18]
MATDPGTIEFLMDQLGTRGASYSTRRMFGEYCLYREGLPVAFVCDDVLFVKDTPVGRDAMTAAGVLAFGPPYPGAKDYLRLPPDGWDEGQWLRGLLDATAAALPAPRIKKADGATKPAAAKKKPTTKKAAGTATTKRAVGKKSVSNNKRAFAKKAAPAKKVAPPRGTKRPSTKASASKTGKRTAVKKTTSAAKPRSSSNKRKG